MIFTHTHTPWAFPFQLRRKQQSFHSSFECYRYSDCSILPDKCWKQYHKSKKFHILWTFTSCSMLNKRTWCNLCCFWTGINSLFHLSVGWAALFIDVFFSVGSENYQNIIESQCSSCFCLVSVITLKKTLILFVPACMRDLQSLFSTGAYRRRFCRFLVFKFVFMCWQNNIYLCGALFNTFLYFTLASLSEQPILMPLYFVV